LQGLLVERDEGGDATDGSAAREDDDAASDGRIRGRRPSDAASVRVDGDVAADERTNARLVTAAKRAL
jgi:hypothetical protein